MKSQAILATFLASTLLTALLAVSWTRDLREPQVILLDAGNGISALVLSGDARVLIVAGIDPIALGNSLAGVRRLTTNRIDLILDTVPGGSDLDITGRRTIRLADPPVAHRTPGSVLPATTLPNPLLIELPGDLSVEFAVVAPPSSVDKQTPAWRALIRSSGATIVLLSRAEDADLFLAIGPVAAIVISSGSPDIAKIKIDADLLIVGATSSPGEGRRLREEVAATFSNPMWTARIFANQVLRLRFEVNGLRIPDNAQLVQPDFAES